ncbi:uncharacterized protein B4U80_03444 [Leptotrombidium deliense]|uniref:PH domain-containing protein n=1 Tax=Leptotrombidium deliense TaxID=299467 RepID=A0A443SLN9_9ACAR|nr:uncharacterized protein B4U80_03444 [Leptotrombidium deliense]
MDGIRVQFTRRKSAGGNGASFRSPSVRRSDQLSVTLRGWLHRLEGAALKQWKRRWFVLGEYCLFHYKDSDEEKLLGSILLPSYRVSPCIQSEDGITRKYAFKLEHQNMKTYYLASDSKESTAQWMNALSLASIMQVNGNKPPVVQHLSQSPSSSYPPRNRPDGHDVDSSQQRTNDDTEETEEDSGFVSYKPRRGVTPNSTNNYLGSGDKYPGSYNSGALPTISYPSSQYRVSNQLLPHQKRSHYVNAPPKPRRQQIGDTIYDYSDNFHNKGYPIPPGAQYHQTYVGGGGPAPDLIVHNNGNGNYLPPPSYFGYFAQNRNHINNHHTDETNTTSPLSSPSSPTSSNAHYSVLPMSRLNSNHKEPVQSYISPPPQFRLPVRPHSADFLERDHEEQTTAERENEQNIYERSQQRQQHYQSQYGVIQPKQAFHMEQSQQQLQHHQQSSQQQSQQVHQQQQPLTVTQRVPMRSKSSLERYDPYYYNKYYDEYDTPQQLQQNIASTAKTISSMTSPPHRPWSDYLQQQSQRELSDRSATTPVSSTPSAAIGRHKPQPPTSLLVPEIPIKSQQNQQQREESLQRLLEWKQRMLQSPLTKRNVNSKNHSRNVAVNSFQQTTDANNEIPARPPLPKEYKSKVSMLYKSEKDNNEEKRSEPLIVRERSKSFGSLGPGNDVCYSSDDEGNVEFNGSMPEPMARKRKSNDSDDRKSPEYMNIIYVEDPSVERSGGDGQEELKQNDLKCDDYYTKLQNNSPVKVDEANEADFLKETHRAAENLSRGHLRISFRSALSSNSQKAEDKRNFVVKSPPIPPPKPSKDECLGNVEVLQLKEKHYQHLQTENDEDDVIRKLVKFYNSQRARPAPNFVKDRIKSIENDQISSKAIYRPKVSLGISSGVASDSELLEKRCNFEDDTITTKSAPVINGTSVLADLRKAAEMRKEQLYSEKLKENCECESDVETITGDDESKTIEVTKEVIEHCDEEDHGYLTMDSKLSGNGDDVYVPMSSFVNNDKSANFDDENDAGADADDEMSRDFDSIQYQNELLKCGSLYQVPKSDLNYERSLQMAAMQQMQTQTMPKWNNHDVTCDEFSLSTPVCCFGSEPPLAAKPTSHCSSFLSQSWIKDLLDPNPAYESFDALRINEMQNVILQNIVDSDQSDRNSAKSQSNAPYYYSDLLTESEHKALTEKIAAFHNNSPPPSLLSRCSALNNIRYLGTTSLQKLDVGKKVNKIKEDDEFSACTTPVKRCFTPLTTMKANDRHGTSSPFNEKLLRRRSRSLNELTDDNDPVYENVDFFMVGKEVISDPKHILAMNAAADGEIPLDCADIPFLDTISTQCLHSDNLPLQSVIYEVGRDIHRRCRSTIPVYSDSDSSVIELGGDLVSFFSSYYSRNAETIEHFYNLGSQSGTYSGHKVRRRRMSRNSRSKDDLNNVSDSETTAKPPPPPPLPLGYNDYGYPYYNLNDSSMQSLKQQQKLSRSVGTGLHYQEPESLRSRLCVSAGDLVGKSHEELVLLLIQMRRTQSHLASTCDQLRLQMESEEKLIEIEPQRRDEHKARFRDLREKLVDAEREYNLRFPVINMIDKMVKLNYGTNTGSVQDLLDNKDENEFSRNRAKAASTSFLDKLPPVVSEKETVSTIPANDEEIESNDYNRNLMDSYEKNDNINKTLEGVQSSLANFNADNASHTSSTSSSSSDIEKMKKQQNVLESELGRVRGLLAQSAKRLEERAAENARMEQDMIMAKSKLNQVLCSPSSSSSTSFNVESHNSSVIEAELESIDKAIEDLNSKRKELLESFRKNKVTGETSLLVRASPTGLAGSAPLPEKKKRPATSYMETDVDSLESRDLSQYSYLRYLLASEGDAESAPLYENLDTSDASRFFQTYDETGKSIPDFMCDENMRQLYALQNNLNGDLKSGCVTES